MLGKLSLTVSNLTPKIGLGSLANFDGSSGMLHSISNSYDRLFISCDWTKVQLAHQDFASEQGETRVNQRRVTASEQRQARPPCRIGFDREHSRHSRCHQTTCPSCSS